MANKDPVDKAIEDLETALKSRVENVPRRIRKIIEDLRKHDAKKTLEKKTLSLSAPVDYIFMEDIAYPEVYPTRKEARQAVMVIKNTLHQEEVWNNEELSEGYHQNKFFRTLDGVDQGIERTIKIYIGHLVP